MLVVKRVCEELEEGRGSLRLRYKSFQRCFLKFSSPSSAKKKFSTIFFSFVVERKSFQRGSFSSVEKSFSTIFPFRSRKEKFFNGVSFLWKSKKNFQRVFPFEIERKVFDGLIVIIGKKGFRRRLHFGSRKKVNFEDPNEETLSALSSFNW